MNLYFLGRFAVKKIAVGESHTYLVDILREVRLLEALRHPNIVTYHHSWLETTQFSSFGPKVPALLYVPRFKSLITLKSSQYAYAMGRGWEVCPTLLLVNPDL
jgi:serine/threonine protein kinase